METRKIEIIEKGGIKEGLIHRKNGDICSIPVQLANAYIKAGLAKCVKTGEVGNRIAGAVLLDIDPLLIRTST